MSDPARTPSDSDLELMRIALERRRLHVDVIKWLIVAIGAAVSFWVIDYGRLRLEEFRATREDERALLNAYLAASDASQPDVWIRKLNLIRTLSDSEALDAWTERELDYVTECLAKAAVHQETLKTTAALLDPSSADKADRERFEQLYWADLPYVGESDAVAQAMIAFRDVLASDPSEGALNGPMIALSKALREDDPRKDSDCGRGRP